MMRNGRRRRISESATGERIQLSGGYAFRDLPRASRER